MNNKFKILLVEDDESIAVMVRAMLENSGYQVIWTDTIFSAQMLYASHIPDLVIMDLGLPDGDGIALIEALRKAGSTPVIVLSARTQETEKVKAFDTGANDYVTKPFSTAEFLARVRAFLRVTVRVPSGDTEGAGVFRTGKLKIEYSSRRVFIEQTEVMLTQTEYNILSLLSENTGKMMTYAAIIRAIWGASTEGSVKKLQVNMANIRKKLFAASGENRYIKNEFGVGYRMEGE